MIKSIRSRGVLLTYSILFAVTMTLAMLCCFGGAQPTFALEPESPKESGIKSKLSKIKKAIFSGNSKGPQFDAPYYRQLERDGAQWAQDDKQVEDKLASLRERFGKSPNIIYILADDVGWGELGCYLGGKLRGTPSPALDKMASEGMQFLSSYAEPSCTPTRLALLTGRHPFRTGVNAVLWPGQTEGLASEEVTIAEVLSKAGYHTGMWGKWHVGELPHQAPEAQGFDYAYYGLYNGAPFSWVDAREHYNQDTIAGPAHFLDFPGTAEYKKRYGIDIQGIFEARKGQKRKEVAKLSSLEMDKFEAESARQIIEFIKTKGKTDKPFFVYWATYAQQLAGSPKKYRFGEGVDYLNNQAAEMAQHNSSVSKILATLKDEGLAENTLVVWYSDNGPMYAFWPNSGYSWLRGEKGQVYEGGVRVPAIAWWPGMIEPGQNPIDMIHVTDLFTTAARLAGAIEEIPTDRITDGLDQSPLMLLGEGHSRRNYMFHYSGRNIGAVRYGDLKAVITGDPASGSLPQVEIYNIARDPRETHGKFYPYLWAITPFQQLIQSHIAKIEDFPNRKLKPEHDTHEKAELTPHD